MLYPNGCTRILDVLHVHVVCGTCTAVQDREPGLISEDVLKDYSEELMKLVGDKPITETTTVNDVRDEQRKIKATRRQELKDRYRA